MNRGIDKTAADPGYVSGKGALRILDVKPQTLYAYVSRGWIRSVHQPGCKASL